MPNPLTDFLLPAATERFILLANHVLTAAPVAPERLMAHAGRVLRIEITGWRLPVPPPPPLALRITPAGLLESVEVGPEGAEVPADLRLRVDASQPLEAAKRVAAGEMPQVQIEGDVGLAADVNWVISNVRWDIAADLERVFGPAIAEGLSRFGDNAAAALRSVAQGAASVLRRS